MFAKWTLNTHGKRSVNIQQQQRERSKREKKESFQRIFQQFSIFVQRFRFIDSRIKLHPAAAVRLTSTGLGSLHGNYILTRLFSFFPFVPSSLSFSLHIDVLFVGICSHLFEARTVRFGRRRECVSSTSNNNAKCTIRRIKRKRWKVPRLSFRRTHSHRRKSISNADGLMSHGKTVRTIELSEEEAREKTKNCDWISDWHWKYW